MRANTTFDPAITPDERRFWIAAAVSCIIPGGPIDPRKAARIKASYADALLDEYRVRFLRHEHTHELSIAS